MCEKHCVSVATVNPEAKAVARSTEETLAPTPDPAAAPHTMNTYRNDARHSEIMDLVGGRVVVEKQMDFSYTSSSADALWLPRPRPHPSSGIVLDLILPPELDCSNLGLHTESHGSQTTAYDL